MSIFEKKAFSGKFPNFLNYRLACFAKNGEKRGKESSYWGINLLLVIAYHYTLKSSGEPTLFPLNLRLFTSACEIFLSFCGIEVYYFVRYLK
ncbi:hypothetical protein T4A_7487 [Trichinella pseudospiralis]|uniref:Uncharacterized protein n=1 Tax=Trichinella pseudospiralis TaxID=6337 RepID=A0A0V1DRG2_TRIPS|nr:hypothetical protein T4A_7487 [Trichinella pseudospiralis]